jgi:hypothetical protein
MTWIAGCIRFDPTLLTKQRILIHEDKRTRRNFKVPRAGFLFPQGQFPYSMDRTAPGLTETVYASHVTLPAWYNADFSSTHLELTYGAISLSNLSDLQHDGFFMLWGLLYPADPDGTWLGAAYHDPEICFSENAVPFCRVYRHDANWQSIDHAHLDSPAWIRKLIRLAQSQDQTAGRIDHDLSPSKVSYFSRTWANQNKDLVCISGSISLVRFVGRKAYQISVDIEVK